MAAEHSDDTEMVMERQDTLDRLLRLIEQLGPSDRQVILLYLEGLNGALAAGWALFSLIAARQNIWPSTIAREAGMQTCLAFSRNELRRKLNYSEHFGRTLAGPILLRSGYLWRLSFFRTSLSRIN